MWSCTECHKTYAYLHKLQHHQTWSCPGRKRTSDVCDLARRPLSSNIFSLDKESEEVNEGGAVKEGEKPTEEENEGANEDKEVALKVGSQQLIKCCLASFLADQV